MKQLFLVWSSLCLFSGGALSHAADIDFTTQVLPIFKEHCTKCHGEKKGMGKLRLHTPQVIQAKQAQDEHLLIAGTPDKSELYQRLILPAGHKKIMPKKADPLAKEKIEIIRLWIEQGAIFALASEVSLPAGTEQNSPAEKLEPEHQQLPLPEVGPADAAAIEKLTAAGAQVAPLFANSALLQVSFALCEEPATDADLQLLEAVGPKVYALNLATAQVSDQGLAVLARLPNLSQLHLEKSSIADSGLAPLSGLQGLQYINLYGTVITDAGLKHLEGLPHLQKLYLWQTKVSYDAAMALEKRIPGLVTNLGFDHPVITRKRLEKQLKTAKEQAKQTSEETKNLKEQLEAATKSEEKVKQQLEEIQKELAALDGQEKPPAEEKEPAEPAQEQAN